MRILVIEDDDRIASLVVEALGQNGYQAQRAADGRTGLDRLREDGWDAAVVDIMLPLMDGLTVVQNARQAGVRTPIIFLSAKRALDDRISGLQAGGDDYLVKPFAMSELMARVQALIRRANGIAEPVKLAVDDLEMDLVRRKVLHRGREVLLQPREFALLEYLVRHRGSVVSKTTLMEQVWDYNFDPETSVVETTVSRLRNKLTEAGLDGGELIQTIRGVGYVIDH